MNKAQTHKTYYPALDGLRGVGCLLVMAFHMYWIFQTIGNHLSLSLKHMSQQPRSFLEIGWIGVDMFFILSGFLISRILLSTKKEPHFQWHFYYRRILRIFPLYFAVLLFALFIIPLFPQWFMPDRQLAKAPQFTFFIQNFTVRTFSSYTMLHTWSVAVEVHFYILWPLLIGRLNEKQLLRLFLGIVIAMPFLRYLALLFFPLPGLLYLFSPFRFDYFALGGLLALWIRSENKKEELFHKMTSFLTFILLPCVVVLMMMTNPLSVMFDVKKKVFNTFIFSSMALSLTGLIGQLVLGRRQVFCAVFENPILVYLGKISFGLYMFHMIVFVNVMNGFNQLKPHFSFLQGPLEVPIIAFTMTTITILLASVSWQFFEGYFLRIKSK